MQAHKDGCQSRSIEGGLGEPDKSLLKDSLRQVTITCKGDSLDAGWVSLNLPVHQGTTHPRKQMGLHFCGNDVPFWQLAL